MATLKSLAKDTAIYGLSSIVGRFLNWGLVPLYTRVFPDEEYGIITYIYSFVAIALVILIYGMETGFFRFINHIDEKNPIRVYSTSLVSLFATSTLFFAVVCLFINPIATALDLPDNPDFIIIMAATTAIDAFSAIPFCYIRYKKQAVKFATIKLVGIIVNILLNLYFILLCPWLMNNHPQFLPSFYNPAYGVGYIFLSNLIASAITLLILTPTLRIKLQFSADLLRRMLHYSFPILILGIAGIMNQNIDKILLKSLIPGTEAALSAVGIYGANYKIAIVMVMFIQAFRFAYEPIIFSQNRSTSSSKDLLYAQAMKYFIIFGLLIFLSVMFFLPIIKHFIGNDYLSGLNVVPIIMIAELFNGIFFNLSLWYKLTDRTIWGSYFSILGLIVTLSLNFLLVPKVGYIGAAWAAFFCYLVMMVASYLVGRRYYPIPYDLKSAATYTLIAAVAYIAGIAVTFSNELLLLGYRSIIIIAFILIVLKRESLPQLSTKVFKRKP